MNPQRAEKQFASLLVLIFLFLSLNVAFFSWRAHISSVEEYTKEVDTRLNAATELKAQKIALWRVEQQRGAAIFHKNQTFAGLVARYFAASDDESAVVHLRDWLDDYASERQYERALLLDADGVVRLAFPPGGEQEVWPEYVEMGLSGEEEGPVFVDYYQNQASNLPLFAVVTPVFDPDNGRFLGALALQTDFADELTDLLSSTTTLGAQNRFFLLHENGGDSRLLQPIGQSANLQLTQPLTGANCAALMGDSATGAMRSVMQTVPNSDWQLLLCAAEADLYAALDSHSRYDLLLAVSLILLLGVTGAMIWQWDRSRFYRQAYEAAQAVSAAQEQAQTEADLLRNLAAHVPGAIYQYQFYPDGRSRFPYASEGIQHIYAVAPEEVRHDATPVFQRLHPDDLERVTASIVHSFQTGEMWHDIYRVILPERGERWLEGRSMPQQMPDGSVLWHGFITDITERKQMEEALRESEARFRSYVEHAPYGIFIADERGCYLEVNPAASVITGYPAEQLQTMRIGDMVPEKAHADAFAHFQRVREEGYAIGEFPFIHQSGELRDWSVIAIKIAPDRYMSFNQDITDLKRAQAIQSQLSDELEKVFHGSHVPMFLVEAESEETFRYIRTNSIHQQLTGIPLEAIWRKTPQEALGEELGEQIAANYRRCIQSGQPIAYEETLDLPGGCRTWETHLTPAFAPDKRPYLVGSSLDITERRKAEMALEEEKSLLNAIIANIPVLINRYDREGNLLYLNKASEETFGWTTAEARSINLLEALYPDPEYRQEVLDYMFAAGAEWREFNVCARNGDIVPSEWSNFRLEDGSQIGIGLDIRERRRAEKAVRENQQYLQAILATTADGFWVADSSLRIRDANKAYCQMSGYSQAELQQMRTPDLEALENPEESVRRAQRIRQNGAEIFATKHRRKDGTCFDVEVSATYLKMDEMDEGLFVCFCRDITKRKQAEADLRRSHEDLREALQALQEAQHHLIQQERLATLGQLAAGVAHELNNPLTGIILYAQLLQNYRQIDPKMGNDIKQIVTQAQRASSIVRGLLDFARQRPLVKELVQVNETLRSTLNFMAYELRSHQTEVGEKFTPDLPLIAADPQQLQQVFVNLLNNALQALNGRSNNKITISTDFGPSIYPFAGVDIGLVVRVIIQDNGPGMTPEVQKRVFDPFFTTKPPGQGTGLGLSVCHGIVREHGGHIWVESEPEQGSAFFVELPLPTPLDGEAGGQNAADNAPQLPTRRILLVDDEEAIRQVTTRILEPECQVDCAANGQEALHLARQRRYDLIICDLYMPVMGGLEFYEQWRQEHAEQTAVTPILFITGDTINPDVRQRLEKLGAPSLSKPFDIEQLLTTTAALLRGERLT